MPLRKHRRADPIASTEKLTDGTTKVVHQGDTFAIGAHTIVASAKDLRGLTGTPAPFAFTLVDSQLASGRSPTSPTIRSDEFASHATRPGHAPFVKHIYEGALGRDPGASEVQGWQSAFADGATQVNVAVGMSEVPKR